MAERKPMKIAVLTVSDSSSQGQRPDTSGPSLASLIFTSQRVATETVDVELVPDEKDQISAKLIELAESNDVVITTGGTGFSPRDVTPEATLAVIDKRCSGLEVALHMRSLQSTPMAALSRAIAGIRGSTIIVNFPGSVKAVKELWPVLETVVGHAVDLLKNDDDGSLHKKLQATSLDK